MNGIRRLYVEKKGGRGFDVAAEQVFEDIKENLGIAGITGLRIINRYDIEGLTDEAYEACKYAVFAEPPLDFAYDGDFPRDENDFTFAVKLLPGQYDQRADSAVSCCKMVLAGENAHDSGILVEAARVYVCSGALTPGDREKIKKYCINDVDETEASFDMPESLVMVLPEPPDVESIKGFTEMNSESLEELLTKMGLAMSSADIAMLRDYYKNEEKRDPTIAEIRVVDTYWSDHCRHTTFLTEIRNIAVDDGFYKNIIEKALELYLDARREVYGEKASGRPVSLMDAATIGMKLMKKRGLLDDLDESEEVNAPSIAVNAVVNGKPEEWLVMFKNETHNHPTEIEPFGGAATCLGGAIRDPLSGRAFVYHAMRVTGSGDPRTPVEETLPGKLPQRKITNGAASGFSSYGNQIGLATGLVSEVYHDGYIAKRMEIGAVLGAVKRENVIRRAPEDGDAVILAGGRTGRDGIGGATGSSKEHTDESIHICGAEVQKGNAPEERKLQRLFRNPDAARMIKRCNDFGAGGVSVAVGELADGLEINLDRVLKKYDGLDGTELAISESQERMAVVVSAADADRFMRLAAEENLEAAVIAKVTGAKRLVMLWRGKEIVNISREFLNQNGAKRFTDAAVSIPAKKQQETAFAGDIKSRWLENLGRLNVAAQKGLSERFDSVIGAGTVLMPYGGRHQLTPVQAMAAKLPVAGGDTDTCTIASYGFNPHLSEWSPFHGAALAVVESVCKIAAAGGSAGKTRLSLQEYFGRTGNDPYRFGKPLAALLGAFWAQCGLGIAAVGGKDSMSGTFKNIEVPPTLVSFAFCAAKTHDIISPEFKKAGNKIVILDAPYGENDLPDFEKLSFILKLLESLIQNKKVVSAYAVGIGGVSAAVSKMAFGNKIGVKIETERDLFDERCGSFVLEMPEAGEELFVGLPHEIIGKTTDAEVICVNGEGIQLDTAIKAWLEPLDKVFPSGMLEETKETAKNADYVRSGGLKAKTRFARPKVLIPVFPGTNSEYDTQARFEKAGAEVDVFVVKSLNINMLREAAGKLAEKIGASQIIALPGGFSAGDEPEGSGKFIAAMFRNPYVKEATMKFLKERDGLMLGICNGFQALVKLGLLPCGEITELGPDAPTLTYNAIGRHVSMLARTRVVSNLSPWLSLVNVGDVFLSPVSHGEGRFVASEAELDRLMKNGQIATQYADFDGKATYDARFNPNGSMCAVEGITSPDGRIFGKMGHSERIGDGLYKNVPGNFDQSIFEAGIMYFA